jgi:hypothetical protein
MVYNSTLVSKISGALKKNMPTFFGCFDLSVLKHKTLMNEVNESHFINIVQCF